MPRNGSRNGVAPGNPRCAICKHDHDFDMPEDVLDAARTNRLVVFAGAGISTEVPTVMPYTFYDEIARQLGKDPKTITTSFPALMSEYCKQPNGRRKLLQAIKARFDYIQSFPGILGTATRFHTEISTIPHLKEIITTNWDPFFELFCGATPFVAPEDFVFWNMPGRKVFKIHGSVTSYGSVVATNEDYKKCHKQLVRGLIGSNLKMLLATKVVVFVGYSLRDYDFLRIYDFLKKEMKEMLPHAYVVTISSDSADRIRSMGLTPIITDGAYFFRVLKGHLAAEELMIPDERFEAIFRVLTLVRLAHETLHKAFSYKKNPELVICASYQDGLIDAFARMLQQKKMGEYSCLGHVIGLLQTYQEIQQDKRKWRKYLDVAYIEGYMNGLQFLITTDKERKSLPLYYVLGHKEDLKTPREYRRACRNAKQLHKAAYRHAVKVTENADGIEFHHTPFLL